MSTTNETLDAPITGQWRSSPFYVAIGAPFISSVLSILCSAICYRVLPLDAARDQMTQINTMLLVGGGGGALTGAYGIVARGLAITKGKIEKQLPPKMPDTVNTGTATFNPPSAEAQSHGGAEDEMLLPHEYASDPEEDADNVQVQAVLEQEARFANH